MIRAGVLALLLWASLAAPASAKPERIVSLNLCTDQLLLQLVEPARIASLTFLVADPAMSTMADRVGGLRLNHGLAEEILPLDPDLILARSYTARATVQLLRKLGHRVVEVPTAQTLDEVRRNIRIVAAAVEEPEAGEALIADFDARLSQIVPPPGPPAGPRPVAAHFWANGYTSGRGSLVETLLRAAGYENLASRLGLAGAASLPLEVLLRAEPDLLVLGDTRGDAPALANEILRHPALLRAFAGRPQVVIPDSLRACGIPVIAEAIERLAAARPATRSRSKP